MSVYTFGVYSNRDTKLGEVNVEAGDRIDAATKYASIMDSPMTAGVLECVRCDPPPKAYIAIDVA
ncbi:hypothetical protein HNR56_003157 [Roseospira marina]|nr:hypothetical protein [Roseospira marina]MBB5088449.1 hypothetical protein [Roseospira marina]